MLLLFYPQKSHRRSHLNIVPVIVCKGTKKQPQYKTKSEVFSISSYKYAAFFQIVLKKALIYRIYAKFQRNFLHMSNIVCIFATK